MNNCCKCGQTPIKCRCELRGVKRCTNNPPQRACVTQCSTDNPCDDNCRPCKSMVKICSYVVPTLEEGLVFRNSFIYCTADNTTYYITDKGGEIPFGARPMFIDNFNPAETPIPGQQVYDFANNIGYVFSPDGTYRSFPLTNPLR